MPEKNEIDNILKDKAKDNLTPNDFIINGKESFAMLYNILNRAKRNEKLQNKLLEVELKNQELLNELLKIEIRRTDKGGRRISHGTVDIGNMLIVDTTEEPGKVKGYWFKNDGPNDVLFGVNASSSAKTLEEPVIDIDSPGFVTVKSGEIESATNNENVIDNIFVKALIGPSDYRLKLTW